MKMKKDKNEKEKMKDRREEEKRREGEKEKSMRRRKKKDEDEAEITTSQYSEFINYYSYNVALFFGLIRDTVTFLPSFELQMKLLMHPW